MFPKIYLAIDNCFATKRWTKPADWAKIIGDCGIHYVESSADTECDMLYSDPSYLERFYYEASAACAANGLTVASVYTGHGTYSTLGLTHTDAECRERMLTGWMFRHIENAAKFGAVAGYYCHAFDDSVLQDPGMYAEYREILFGQMKRIAGFSGKQGVIPSLEQMYSPQQYPWRIDDVFDLIKNVGSSDNIYITVDTGHQYGQKRFLKPGKNDIVNAIKAKKEIYVGPAKSHVIFARAQRGDIDCERAADEISAINENYPYLFSTEKDSDTYEWLREVGIYAPLVHLQQTDGRSSSHKDFSEKNNKAGNISGENVIAALYEGFAKNTSPIIKPVDRIYLTLELFYPNVAYGHDIIESIKTSADYWRKFIPDDGIALDEAAALLNK